MHRADQDLSADRPRSAAPPVIPQQRSRPGQSRKPPQKAPQQHEGQGMALVLGVVLLLVLVGALTMH